MYDDIRRDPSTAAGHDLVTDCAERVMPGLADRKLIYSVVKIAYL